MYEQAVIAQWISVCIQGKKDRKKDLGKGALYNLLSKKIWGENATVLQHRGKKRLIKIKLFIEKRTKMHQV